MPNSSSLLQVENLTTVLKTKSESQIIVSDLSFKIESGQTVALLGESGSGRSITALSIMQLLPRNAFHASASRIIFQGTNLLSLPEANMRKVRGRDIAMIFQEPMTSLNPGLKIGEQMNAALRLHQRLNRINRQQETAALLEQVRIDPSRVIKAYPHELSSGMKQRVAIAMALAAKPKLLIADEPIAALDITTQITILNLLKQLQKEYQMAILFITHNLQLAQKMSDEVGIMCKGKLIEQGKTSTIVQNPQQVYTQKLFNVKSTVNKVEFLESGEELLRLKQLSVHFPIKQGLFRRTVGTVPAVQEVSFSIRAGETLALVGESGCGKTTIAKTVLSFLKPTRGSVFWLGESIHTMDRKTLRKKREYFQIIFQDPFRSMNPRFRVLDILEEEMLALDIGTDAAERIDRIDTVLKQVGLLPEYKYRYPHEFSGEQRQRICIARALVLGARLIVWDEPTSNLDVSVGVQIIDLLLELQQEFELAYLFITHNISIVKAMAHSVAVMRQGRIVEYGSCDAVFNYPQDAYTKTLLEAI